MKLSIVIVNYNVCYFLEQCLRSVENAIKNLEVEVFIVDNNSVDGSVEMVKEKFSHFKLIETGANLGFSKGNNVAIREAKGEYVLLLNPDTLVEEDTFSKCCLFMDEHPDAGGLGIYMVDGAGNFLPESKRGLPTPEVAFYKIFGLANLFPKSEKFGKYHLGYLDNHETHEIDVLSGAYMFMRKSVLDKIGLLDEDYFMYGEDIDLSYRITKGGYKNYYYPDARIIHYKGESTKKTSVNYVFIFYKAMIIFAKKHFSKKNAKIFSFLINIAIYLKAGFDIVINFIKKSLITIFDASIIFLMMYFLKVFWENNYKEVLVDYPPEFMGVAVPLYIVTWLITNHLGGGNDRPLEINKVLRGTFIGTLVIAAATNFVDSYRFSKALILMGGIGAFSVLTFNRWILHFIKYRTWKLSKASPKKIAIVGDLHEAERVYGLLDSINANVECIGFISFEEDNQKKEKYLGSISKIEEAISIHHLDELIFCSKDVPANSIIQLMVELNTSVEYKIVPNDSDYVIGSNSKNSNGDLYTIDIRLNISKKSNVRNKRILDIAFSLLFILSSPLVIWFVERKNMSFKNALNVLFAKNTWVGYSNMYNVKLPKIKRGVIPPGDTNDVLQDYQYAKDYTVLTDLRILLKSITKLGG